MYIVLNGNTSGYVLFWVYSLLIQSYLKMNVDIMSNKFTRRLDIGRVCSYEVGQY